MNRIFKCYTWRRVVLLSMSMASAAPAAAQVRYDVANTRVEILGLERWTRRMLEDSIAHYVPGQKLYSAACMATLRYQLKFRDALVASYSGFDGPTSKREFLSIRLVEPGDSTAVQWRRVPTDPFESLMPAYAALIVPVTDSMGGILTGRLTYGLRARDSVTRERMLASADSATRDVAERVAAFLMAHRSDGERRRATRALDSSSVYANRMAAALVLSNFPEHDSTWYSLVRALRDPHETVRFAAAAAISRMPRRPVDWAPATADLRAILGGTNLTQTEPIMRLLTETRIDPGLARPLLRGNDLWVQRLLASEAPTAAQTVTAFLVAMNGGSDLGGLPAWRAWLVAR